MLWFNRGWRGVRNELGREDLLEGNAAVVSPRAVGGGISRDGSGASATSFAERGCRIRVRFVIDSDEYIVWPAVGFAHC